MMIVCQENGKDRKLEAMNDSDNGGRRKNVDRRQYNYTVHIPERRLGTERRNSEDRRKDTSRSDAQ
jgi:hypothetical protein